MRIFCILTVWFLAMLVLHCKVVYIYAFIQNGAVLPENETQLMGNSDSFSGKLSTVGMRQQYNLGKRLKDKYIVEQELGFEWFDYRHAEFNASDQHASEQSALSFAYGFYPLRTGLDIFKTVDRKFLAPPYQTSVQRNLKVEERMGFALMQGFQPIPFHPLLGIKLDKRTKGSMASQAQDFGDNHISKWLGSHAGFLQVIKRRLGKLDKSNEDVLMEYEAIQEELYFGKPLPAHLRKNDYQQLKYLYKRYQALRSSRPSALSAINVSLSALKSRLELASKGENNLTMNFVFHSHKDIWPILLFFNLTSPACIDDQHHSKHVSALNCVAQPSFSSSLIFELHEDKGKHTIMALYNGVYVNLCEKRSHTCGLKDFLARLGPNMNKVASTNSQKVPQENSKTDQ